MALEVLIGKSDQFKDRFDCSESGAEINEKRDSSALQDLSEEREERRFRPGEMHQLVEQRPDE
jgi:hypothetical protein